MRDTLVRIISIFLAIISIIILVVFLQNVFYNGKPFTVLGHRLIIMTDDYEKEQISENDLIIVNEKNTNDLKENDLVAYTLEKNKSTAVGTLKSIDTSTATLKVTNLNDEITISKDSLIGTYELKVPKVGKYILFLRTLKGFLLSLGTIFIIMVIITSFSKIILFIKKLFTKKY
ncbi:MAG: hypothetical protein MR846_03985 [Tenericutes bacterium]|nr:hypothetical protein [Mycoplasmatota bacterium]MDD6941985.1 hypothetical protein [bacterium]MDY2697778.1 hypothetical protein [Bacilli bacterium]